jgi:hypothetical protein
LARTLNPLILALIPSPAGSAFTYSAMPISLGINIGVHLVKRMPLPTFGLPRTRRFSPRFAFGAPCLFFRPLTYPARPASVRIDVHSTVNDPVIGIPGLLHRIWISAAAGWHYSSRRALSAIELAVSRRFRDSASASSAAALQCRQRGS